MKEKLIIRNFGPIKEVELDLGRFTILIGEQATGKSTVAKVLAVCRYFSYIAGEEISSFADGIELWGLKEHIKENSFIFYECQHYSLTAKIVTGTLQQYDSTIEEPYEEEYTIFSASLNPISPEFKHLLSELEKIKNIKSGNGEGIIARSIPTSFFLNDVKNVLDNPFYLPTERGLQSIFDIGQNSIQNLSSALFAQLSKMDGIARLFKQETYIEPLNIYYVNRNGHGFIRKANESTYYSLYNAASGYQAVIPIVLVVKYYTELRKKSKTFLIEEPELDVFPSTQNELIQYLSDKAKIYDSMVLFTTHSPYTLTSVNNMMFAYQVGQIEPEKTSNIIDKKYWLNPKDVSAYMLRFDNEIGGITHENIIDNEISQIKAEKIDEVSRNLNKKYDEMLDIKYAKQ